MASFKKIPISIILVCCLLFAFPPPTNAGLLSGLVTKVIVGGTEEVIYETIKLGLEQNDNLPAGRADCIVNFLRDTNAAKDLLSFKIITNSNQVEEALKFKLNVANFFCTFNIDSVGLAIVACISFVLLLIGSCYCCCKCCYYCCCCCFRTRSRDNLPRNFELINRLYDVEKDTQQTEWTRMS